MCAAVPATPVVVTLPLTDLSAPTVMVPLPVAEVVTGGTSWLPLSTTFTSWLQDIPGHPAMSTATAPMTAHKPDLAVRFSRVIDVASVPVGATWCGSPRPRRRRPTRPSAPGPLYRCSRSCTGSGAHRGLPRPSEASEKVHHRGIDLRRPFLLGPVAAAGEHDGPAQGRDESRQIRDELVHAPEGEDEVPVTGHIERGNRDPRASEWRQQFPVPVDIAVPVQPAAETRARELAGIKVDVGPGEPRRQRA